MIDTLMKLMLTMMAPRLGAICTGGPGLHSSRANLDIFIIIMSGPKEEWSLDPFPLSPEEYAVFMFHIQIDNTMALKLPSKKKRSENFHGRPSLI